MSISHAYHNTESGLCGVIQLEIELLSPLFVGTGDLETDQETLVYHRFARMGGSLVIPGTTIKGVVRSYAEALSSSCTLDRTGTMRQCSGDNLCICCSIFGTLGFRGRVCFCDSRFEGSTEIRSVEVRRSGRDWGGRRFYHHDKPANPEDINGDGVSEKERLEVVLPDGRRIACDLFFENLTLREMGLLILAMGLSPRHRFRLKLGGGKNRLLGSVRFYVRQAGGILVRSPTNYTYFNGAMEQKWLESWCNGDAHQDPIEAYLESLDEGQRRAVEAMVARFETSPPATDISAPPERGRRRRRGNRQ
jgi:CRISPR/Cas system CSM-associated protein Csm3 (group 7 of RAMP superfamily)